MEADEYLKMHALEERMWWYRGLHANLLTLYRLASPIRPVMPILDAGCGTGGLLKQLGPGAVGMDLASAAAGLARAKSGAPVCVGSINDMPFADGSLGAIFSADVLYHRAVDERAALENCHRCLMPGGLLVLNLPAYDWMSSAHDRAVHAARRYTRRRIEQRLRAAGFDRIRTSYWNMLLFPLMVMRRKLLSGSATTSDVMLYPAPIEALFRTVLRLENWALARGLSLPFGGSVLAVAVKHG
ncbi:MAG TPA: class I SAM-dependent methyltransferase [Aliidongia sp.]|nr:class I SAM-dependent methyltransferase [Aliidongia sp.]